MDTIRSNKVLSTIFILTVIAALAACFHRYYYSKNYTYLVEASCDPSLEPCFVRDCSNPDDCPPNQLSFYSQFEVKARDFDECTTNSCERECKSGLIECTIVECTLDSADECSALAENTSEDDMQIE